MENNNLELWREKATSNILYDLAVIGIRLGLTQVQLDNSIDVSRHTIMQVENKKAKLY